MYVICSWWWMIMEQPRLGDKVKWFDVMLFAAALLQLFMMDEPSIDHSQQHHSFPVASVVYDGVLRVRFVSIFLFPYFLASLFFPWL